MNTQTCPTCGLPALATASGLLDPQPARLGVHRPDGTVVSRAEVLRAHAEGRPTGYRRHRCGEAADPAADPGEQLGLFDISQTSTTTRKRIK